MDIIEKFPDFRFEPDTDEIFRYKPKTRTIYYSLERLRSEQGKFMLLHEIGHALLDHRQPSDDQLYQIERDAWDVARLLADKLGVKRDELYVSKALRQAKSLGY